MRPVRRVLQRFWTQESSLTALTVWLVVVVFLIYPLTGGNRAPTLWSDLALSFLFISGAAVVGGRKEYGLAAASGMLAVMSVHWVSAFSPSLALQVADRALVGAVLLALAMIVLARVFAEGETTIHRIMGAICAYLLLGLAWAYAYALVQILEPGAIEFSGTTVPARYSVVYFSFITLATVGYGDIVPVHPVARALATMEALTGQLYLAILIARLVAREVADSRVRRGAAHREKEEIFR